jgi:hypothetical protein
MAVTLNASTSSGFIQTADTSGELNLQSNGSTKLSVLSTGVSGTLVQGTAVASTSGTSIDFTGIPSWVKRITVLLNSISTNGTSLFLIQLGDAGGIETTGYLSGVGARGNETTSTAGFVLNQAGTTAQGFTGMNTISLVSSNLWLSSGNLNRTGTGGDGFANNSSGTKTLSDTLTQIRITTVNGTDTFDLGSINIMYEG